MAAKRKSKGKKAQRRAPAAAKKSRTPRRKVARRPRANLRVTPAPSAVESDGKMRLNRFLAGAGVCSRRAADTIIEAGRVTVNGSMVSRLGVRVHPGEDEVCVDGARARLEAPVYILFNKPRDVICTNARNEIRRRAIDFLQGIRGRIYTVGRLDADSEGLLLLTNDGEFAQAVAHPSHGVPKTYAVLVRGRVDSEARQKLRKGIWLSEGPTAGGVFRVERTSRDRTYFKVTIREGKNREIRRVFARLGHTVMSLKRVRIGNLSLHGLKPGGHRFLRPEEVRELVALAEGKA